MKLLLQIIVSMIMGIALAMAQHSGGVKAMTDEQLEHVLAE